ASTTTSNESKLTLTAAEIPNGSYVQMRNFQVIPDVGTVKVTITTWNIPTTLGKGWITQAGTGTRRITYRVGDLAPNTEYEVFKNGVATGYETDANGVITITDTSVTQAITQFEVSL
ncbi:MAG TPA: hypothetical protein VK530_19530, partial [Candidatus Acidoferrum sp.]|nr:hypothetical protein [Candidatus Acidoferrum sp.]